MPNSTHALPEKNNFNFCALPRFEFHIANEIRKKYGFDESLFSINGNVVLADFHSVRVFVQKVNDKREIKDRLSAGQVNAAGLMDEIYHFIFRLYEIHVNPGVFKKALDHLNKVAGEDETRKVLFDFTSTFPPLEIYKGKSSAFDYLNSFTEDRSNAEITIEEMIMLYIANFNPANKKLIELFDENYLSEKKSYEKVIKQLDLFFQNQEKFGPDKQDMFTLFRTPILNSPDNLEAQLDFIREKLGVLLDEKFLKRILTGKDLIKEEFKLEFGGPGGQPTVVPQYKSGLNDYDFLSLGKSGYKYAGDAAKSYDEPENFTPDTNWMPRVVLIAKNSYVWLDQLSKKYQRYIKTLDQIPDEELDELARWNFNGLWLIGIWERSHASKRIKHIMGNIDAVSSAYSLYDYQIAADLGGEYAYNNLNERARARGIRLASDMVPNHAGIYSRWMIEHPEYFIQSGYPPFPNYQFNGEDLSEDPNVQIRIEDGYWQKRDAAVVFQRVDNRYEDVRYIYHGNDGTNMPWNDTAQLNMIRQDVREAVIQKIFEVARKFSIIRFDAAMTLAKKHFSRLWYPEPGRGGDIPSRADYAMTREEFDAAFPEEFWREVVDRINREMPDTLLLAEAFWLMEGYFVRSLGMHRVYNSAFMHMMMKEENAKYRDLISNTLEFEPEILKRYVNFMSNPDEETAIKQFGTDDKYFGVCALMVTLPGLPMFAHGQIEGYTEKYGMEYQRAYYNESPNQWLVERHQREIFPLMKKRYLFSQVANFWLFDFIDGYGSVNENVFAYTNSEYGEHALVFYHNKYEHTAGRIFTSSPKLMLNYGGGKGNRTISISEALHINPAHGHFYIFREHISNLEFIRTGSDIVKNGFYTELGAFKLQIYIDWRELFDDTGEIEKFVWKLENNGVPDMNRAIREFRLETLHYAFETMFDDESIDGFIKTCVTEEKDSIEEHKIKFIDEKFAGLLNTIAGHFSLQCEVEAALQKFEEDIVAVRKLNRLLDEEYNIEKKSSFKEVHRAVRISRDTNYHDNSIIFILWLIIKNIKEFLPEEGKVNRENYFDVMMLDAPLRKILLRLGRGEYEVYRETILLDIIQSEFELINELLTGHSTKIINSKNELKEDGFSILLKNEDVRNYLGVNEFEGVTYYSKENFEDLLDWILTISSLENMKCGKEENLTPEECFGKKALLFKTMVNEFNLVIMLSEKSEYQIKKLIENLSGKL